MAKQKSDVGSQKSDHYEPSLEEQTVREPGEILTGPIGTPGPTGTRGDVGPIGVEGATGDPGLPGVQVEVPAEVIEALGGMPIPAPPVFLGPERPKVTRVGQPLPGGRPDPGGLLASPRPERRQAIKRIDAARESIAKLVKTIEEGLASTGGKICLAIEDADACEAEGFDPIAANSLIEDLHAALAKHLG